MSARETFAREVGVVKTNRKMFSIISCVVSAKKDKKTTTATALERLAKKRRPARARATISLTHALERGKPLGETRFRRHGE